jgi:hypothetical protein
VEDILVSGRGRYVRLTCAQQGVSGAGYGLQEFKVYAQQQAPFSGSALTMPGRIEAENFDIGGESVAYYNSTVGNPGGVYRTNVDVGIEPCTDTNAGYDVAYVNPGEWLEYTVNVPDASAIYGINVRVASGSGGGQLRVRLDGMLLGTVNIPNTGGWQNWQTISLPNVPIAGGTGSRALRVEVINSGFNLNWIELNRVQVCSTNNIALNQSAWASSGGSAAAAFDGDNRSTWTSAASDPQWLMVDLGSIINVARVRLDWQSVDWNNNGYGQASYSKSFSIQFSTDGNTWTNAYSTSNGIGSVNDLAVAGNARYVRMYSTQRINANGTSLYELEVYPGSPLLSITNTTISGTANPSFEYQTVAEGTYSLGDPVFWHSSLSGGALDALINPGTASSGEPWPSSTPPGVDGTNFCQIYIPSSGGGGFVYQDTGVKYQAGKIYQLTAAFGLQTNQNFATGSAMVFYNSSLTTVASQVISAANLISGAFTNQSLTYTATGAEGGNGDIIVGFYVPPSAGNSYFDFDNVQLAILNQPPVITSAPVSQTAAVGTTATFNVGIYGTTPLSYQWQANGGAGFTNLLNSGSVSGANSSVLTITNVTTNFALAYQVIVTNNFGSVTSAPAATLTVTPAPIIATNLVAIQNFSFEANSVPIPPGYETSAFPTSWSSANVSGPVITAVVTPYAGDGRFASYPVPGLDGTNYCQIYMNGGSGGETIYQDLGAANKYQAGTTYTLTAAFGLENGTFPTGALVLYNSSLVAIASNVITSAMLTSGRFTNFSVTYTATGSEGGNGDIVVGFNTTGAGASTSFDVDNVRLTAVAPASTNTALASLVFSPALSFTPAFTAGTFNYTATVAYGSTPTVTVVNANGNATNQLVYNGATNVLVSGVASSALSLNPNPAVTNSLVVQVTAQDGVTRQSYTVNVVQQPNQTKPVLTSGVNAGWLTLSWPLDHLGYRLLAQTNNLNFGVSGNPNDWGTVPGSSATNLLSLLILTTSRNSFFKLVYP